MILELGYTPYTKKQIVEHAIASLANSIMFGTNYNSIIPQNCPFPCEHVGQGLHIVLGKVRPILIHLFTPVVSN
jgi:hypothetical protein